MDVETVPSITQVEQIIDQLYGSFDPQYQKSAQEYLHNLQKQQHAWELASQLLASQSVNSRFFGAHTLQIKLSRDWNTLSPEKREWIHKILLGWIVHLSNGPNVVITKLCLALTAFALQAVPDIWPNFIPNFFEILQSSALAATSSQNEGVTLFVEIPLLEFLTVVPEEVSRADLIGDRKAKVNQELINSIPIVLSTLRNLLADYHGDPDRMLLLKQKSIRCLQSWIIYGVPFESLLPLIDDVINLLPIESTNDLATEVLVEFMLQPHSRSYQNTVCEKMLCCMTSDWAKSQITKSINASARNLCRIMTTFGENFTDYIAIHFLREDIIIYLEMMLMFAGFPGYFESLFDSDVIPIQINKIIEDEEENEFNSSAATKPNLSTNTMGIEQAQKIHEASLVVYQRLIEVLKMKVQYPPDLEWVEWVKDMKERFKNYRRDVGDTIMNSYYILRGRMLAYLIDLLINQLNTTGRDITQWQEIEAALFCLKSISEVVEHDENVYLLRLFNTDVFGNLPIQTNARIRNTALSLIGSYAEWFKVHSQYILPALNYLVPALSDSDSAFTAANSFKEICDTCRNSLVDGIDNLINMYVVVGAHIQNPSQFHDIIITQLEYLTACASSDVIKSNDEVLISFQAKGLTDSFSEIVQNVAEVWYNDNEVINCLCKFLNTGIRTTLNLFSIPIEVIVPLIQLSYQRYPHCYWLDTTVQTVTVYGVSFEYESALSKLLLSITTTTFQFVKNKADMENYPDMVHSFFELLTKYLTKCPIALYTLPSEIFDNILKFSVAGLGLQERLALRSAVAFMGEFIGQHYKDDRITNMGIGGNLPRSLIPQLSTAREHLLTLSPQNRETLNLIESALFVVNLDDYSSGDNLDQFLGNIFHGNGYNRWFDKSMSIIVESNGGAGMHCEHSPCDALVTAFIAEWTLIEPTDLHAKTSGRKITSPRRIRFVTNQQTLKFIQDAEKRISQVITDSDITCPPDAYIQMVIQLAYYKLHRKVVPTYETGSTRQFRHGRTETIRTLSAESKAFVEGMENNSLSTKEKYGLSQAAVKAHSEYTRGASNGKGCDRHLLGLKLLLKEGESHPLFQHPIFAKSQEWLLSTSGLTTGTKFNGTGFGCVYPNGYGINYLPGEHVLKFGMESDTKKFKKVSGGLIYQKDFNEGLAKLSANEYLVLAGTLHSVHAITSQISPVRNSTSSGLEVLEADTFKLYCYQTLTADPAHPSIDVVLHRTYVIYSDYAMKNPFYTPEMPIRSELFDLNLLKLIKQFGGI
nr:85_t:CDS:10 [Entrophospora candida]